MDMRSAVDRDRIFSLKLANIRRGTFSVEASPYLDQH
jgi:hypothetical protein